MKDSYTDGFLNVSKEYGFSLEKETLDKLPGKYSSLQFIIDNLSNILTLSNINKHSILYHIHTTLDNYNDLIEKETDIVLLQSLFRSYTFIASGFIFETVYLNLIEYINFNNKYRNIIPIKVSKPLEILSSKLKINPWLNYWYSYILGNYKKINQKDDLTLENIRTICKFTNLKEESNYQALYIIINEKSKYIIQSIYQCIDGLKKDKISTVTQSLEILYKTLSDIKILFVNNLSLLKYEYNIFLKGNNSIQFEGLNEEYKFYNIFLQEGNISIINTFFGIDEIDILKNYFPICVRNFLEDLETESKVYNILQYILKSNNNLTIIFTLGIFKVIYDLNNFYLDEKCEIISKRIKNCREIFYLLKKSLSSKFTILEKDLLNKIQDI